MIELWTLAIVRLIPLVIWTIVVRRSGPILDLEEPRPEVRFRRMMAIWLVEGACICIAAGGLAIVGLVSGDVAKLLYTAFGAVVAIFGMVVIWTYPKPPK